MASITVVTASAPYSSERFYSTIRFVLTALVEGHKVNLFLLEDAVNAAKQGQKPLELPGLLEHEAMPNCADLLKYAVSQGAVVVACGVCASARGLKQEELVAGAKIGSMHDLVHWVAASDKVLSF